MKKIKLLGMLLAVSIFLVACGNGSGSKDTKNESSNESAKETTETLAETKEEKAVEREDLRKKDSKYLSVDGKEISYADFFKLYDLYSGIISMRESLGSNLSDFVVRNMIIEKDLENKKITVTDEEIYTELENFKKSLGSENEFKRYMNMLGVTDELFKNNIASSVKAKKHKELFESETSVTDAEISALYETSKDNLDYVVAKHILVETEEKAKEIVTKLKNGEDFKKLSDEFSTDTAAKEKGGELGNVTKSGFEAAFVEAAFKLKANEISDPVKTKYGYHVIVVTENKVGMEFHKDELKKTVINQKYEADMKTKIGNSDIKLYDYDGSELKNNAQ